MKYLKIFIWLMVNGELIFQGIHFTFHISREWNFISGILIYVEWKYKRNLELLYDKDIHRINMDGKLIFYFISKWIINWFFICVKY